MDITTGGLTTSCIGTGVRPIRPSASGLSNMRCDPFPRPFISDAPNERSRRTSCLELTLGGLKPPVPSELATPES